MNKDLPTYKTAMRRVEQRNWRLTVCIREKGRMTLCMVSPKGTMRAVKCRP